MQVAKVKLPRIIPAALAARYEHEGYIRRSEMLHVGADGSVWHVAPVLMDCDMVVQFSGVKTGARFRQGDVVRYCGMDFAHKGDTNRGKG